MEGGKYQMRGNWDAMMGSGFELSESIWECLVHSIYYSVLMLVC